LQPSLSTRIELDFVSPESVCSEGQLMRIILSFRHRRFAFSISRLASGVTFRRLLELSNG